ncbi:unnamed protein product [Auanema sp. JU1783]|nr:unnamed protein product [Auanema sp. JU1783]
MINLRKFFHVPQLTLSQVRWKTAKFKPKIAKTKPMKTPSAVALDNFDFYYGPMFGKRWPSIRLGLLNPNKYIAVMNTLSTSWKAHQEILSDSGCFDLLQRVRGKTAEERIEEKKKSVEVQAVKETEYALELNNTVTNMETSTPRSPMENYMRSAAGLNEFQPSRETITPGSLQMKKSQKKNLDFEITGLEGDGAVLPIRKHFIYYPRSLFIQSYDRGVTSDFPPPIKGENGVPSWWLLDGGSLVPVLALGLEKGDNVLDLCAAPGGKSLLALLTGLPDKIVCNDFKLARLGQLKRALSTYIPSDSPESEKVILKRKDGSDLSTWDEIGVYDKVIADVPCSTDRLAVNQDEGNLFSTHNTNQRLSLPQLQTKILINALRAVKVGGSVVYSTCTLSASQNEAVVENAVAIAQQKFGMKIVEESLLQLTTHLTSTGLFRFSEQCKIGALVLPFLPSNFGPMYVCKLTKLE